MGRVKSAEELLLENGYEGTKFLTNYSYDSALVGVTTDGQTVYDYDKMVDWLMKEEGWTMEESAEWIEYNTIRALPYMGEDAPIVIFRLEEYETQSDDCCRCEKNWEKDYEQK